jgi:hypothetical protein
MTKTLQETLHEITSKDESWIIGIKQLRAEWYMSLKDAKDEIERYLALNPNCAMSKRRFADSVEYNGGRLSRLDAINFLLNNGLCIKEVEPGIITGMIGSEGYCYIIGTIRNNNGYYNFTELQEIVNKSIKFLS